MAGYVSEVKFKLTGGIIELEIDDSAIQQNIEYSLREITRYINHTKLVTVPFQSCIDVSQYHISDVRMVYAADVDGYTGSSGDSIASLQDGTSNFAIYQNTPIDPMMWQAYYLGGNGQISNYSNYVNNYYAYAMTKKGTNIGDTHRLSYNYVKSEERLYINQYARCKSVTIEYVPRFDNVEDITSDAWIDILVRLSVANLKVALGRARSRFTQSNALWSQDGERLLEEGNKELDELRTYLDTAGSILRPR